MRTVQILVLAGFTASIANAEETVRETAPETAPATPSSEAAGDETVMRLVTIKYPDSDQTAATDPGNVEVIRGTAQNGKKKRSTRSRRSASANSAAPVVSDSRLKTGARAVSGVSASSAILSSQGKTTEKSD